MPNQNLTYFPKSLSNKAIATYLISLLTVSIIFMQYALPLWLMLFGVVSVVVFFYFSNRLSLQWARLSSKSFEKKLFWTAFIIRLVYVIFIYNLNYELYGTYYESNEGDITWYVPTAEYLADQFWQGNLSYKNISAELTSISDAGYVIYLMLVYIVTFNVSSVIIPLIIKAYLGACACLLTFKITQRHFGDSIGKIAGIFCMLQFNMIWWCGSMMKETEMVFISCAFIDFFDKILYERTYTIKNLTLGLLLGGLLFTFRTALGLCAFGSVFITLMFTPNKVVGINKKIIVGFVVLVSMLIIGGGKLINEVKETAETATSSHQEENMAWRANREHGNAFAKYAGAAVFAPLIFTIPFPSMVYTFQSQEMQVQVNGGNYIKNLLSFFVIYVMFYLLFKKKWKEYVFIISFMISYLLALVLSEFAQSGRFHLPIIPFEMMFAAFGISIVSNRHIKWFNYALVVEFVACISWSWFKLAGRGWI